MQALVCRDACADCGLGTPHWSTQGADLRFCHQKQWPMLRHTLCSMPDMCSNVLPVAGVMSVPFTTCGGGFFNTQLCQVHKLFSQASNLLAGAGDMQRHVAWPLVEGQHRSKEQCGEGNWLIQGEPAVDRQHIQLWHMPLDCLEAKVPTNNTTSFNSIMAATNPSAIMHLTLCRQCERPIQRWCHALEALRCIWLTVWRILIATAATSQLSICPGLLLLQHFGHSG